MGKREKKEQEKYFRVFGKEIEKKIKEKS